MQRPTTSISVSSHFARAASGSFRGIEGHDALGQLFGDGDVGKFCVHEPHRCNQWGCENRAAAEVRGPVIPLMKALFVPDREDRVKPGHEGKDR